MCRATEERIIGTKEKGIVTAPDTEKGDERFPLPSAPVLSLLDRGKLRDAIQVYRSETGASAEQAQAEAVLQDRSVLNRAHEQENLREGEHRTADQPPEPGTDPVLQWLLAACSATGVGAAWQVFGGHVARADPVSIVLFCSSTLFFAAALVSRRLRSRYYWTGMLCGVGIVFALFGFVGAVVQNYEAYYNYYYADNYKYCCPDYGAYVVALLLYAAGSILGVIALVVVGIVSARRVPT
jgi:hypothetical protein